MFYTNVMYKLHKESFELSQRSYERYLRDYLVRPYKTKNNDLHIKTP